MMKPRELLMFPFAFACPSSSAPCVMKCLDQIFALCETAKLVHTLLPDVLHSIRSLISTATNTTPHRRFSMSFFQGNIFVFLDETRACLSASLQPIKQVWSSCSTCGTYGRQPKLCACLLFRWPRMYYVIAGSCFSPRTKWAVWVQRWSTTCCWNSG